MLDDFNIKNEKNYMLESNFDIKPDYSFIDSKEVAELRNQGDFWNEFYKKYKANIHSGILTLSRVGFNEQMDEALVYMQNSSHWLAGRGIYILLKRENDIWNYKQIFPSWIS